MNIAVDFGFDFAIGRQNVFFLVSAAGTYRYYNGQIFANRKELLQRFCAENPDLEYHLLCQVQLMITNLKMPPGKWEF